MYLTFSMLGSIKTPLLQCLFLTSTSSMKGGTSTFRSILAYRRTSAACRAAIGHHSHPFSAWWRVARICLVIPWIATSALPFPCGSSPGVLVIRIPLFYHTNHETGRSIRDPGRCESGSQCTRLPSASRRILSPSSRSPRSSWWLVGLPSEKPELPSLHPFLDLSSVLLAPLCGVPLWGISRPLLLAPLCGVPLWGISLPLLLAPLCGVPLWGISLPLLLAPLCGVPLWGISLPLLLAPSWWRKKRRQTRGRSRRTCPTRTRRSRWEETRGVLDTWHEVSHLVYVSQFAEVPQHEAVWVVPGLHQILAQRWIVGVGLQPRTGKRGAHEYAVHGSSRKHQVWQMRPMQKRRMKRRMAWVNQLKWVDPTFWTAGILEFPEEEHEMQPRGFQGAIPPDDEMSGGVSITWSHFNSSEKRVSPSGVCCLGEKGRRKEKVFGEFEESRNHQLENQWPLFNFWMEFWDMPISSGARHFEDTSNTTIDT